MMMYNGFHTVNNKSYEVFWHDGYHYYMSDLKKGWYYWPAEELRWPPPDWKFDMPSQYDAVGPFISVEEAYKKLMGL